MTLRNKIYIILVLGILFGILCVDCDKVDEKNKKPNDIIPVDTTSNDTSSISNYSIGAGFRYSSYGPSYDPGVEYWSKVGTHISSFFGDAAHPECIWIVGGLQGNGVYLNFPVNTNSPNIFSATTDENKAVFDLFEQNNYKVWLQVEPGMANVDTLIDLVMKQYSHYKCISGFGVDVEWYKSTSDPMGVKVTDDLAKRWVKAVRKYNPNYKIFLKHWLIEKMPDTERDGIVFIDDSQMFEEMETMISEFEDWGEAFAPAKVGFQYGYPYDKKWWGNFDNPAKVVGEEILDRIPNTESLFWVDFTILETYPPSDIE